MFKSLLKKIRFARFSVVHQQSSEAQNSWQSVHFSRLISFAYENVPMWRQLLDKCGMDPRTLQLSDIRRLPVTSKQTYLGRAVDEYTDNSKRLSSHWYKTSGTSGTPFTFLLSDQILEQKYSDFASLKFLWWRGIPPARFASAKLVRIRLRPRAGSNSLFIALEDYLRDPRKVLSQIQAFRPLIVATYPSVLSDIARMVSMDPSVVWRPPPFILSLGETLLPTMRARVTSALKSEIYNHYGFEEVGAVGVECVVHDGFHVNTESVYVEVVDASGNPQKDGTEGRVLVTDLFNYNMPFIRYDSGDYGHLSNEQCTCGLSSPRLWVSGRYSAVLTFGEKRIHHLEFDGAMDGFMNEVLQYQIAKTSETGIIIRVVIGQLARADIDARMKASVAQLVGPHVEISVERVAHIALSDKGKCQIVVDESVPKTVS